MTVNVESIAYFARIGVVFGFGGVVARSSSRGSSFMPHREQLVGLVLWVSGCIGQT